MSNKKTSDHHATPKRVFDYFKSQHELNLKKMFDPCPLYAKFNGLKIKWKKENYINPPYSLIEEFFDKAFTNWILGNDCYFLFPLSKSDKTFFVDYMENWNLSIKFIPFRIKFVGSKNPATQTHCLVIMK